MGGQKMLTQQSQKEDPSFEAEIQKAPRAAEKTEAAGLTEREVQILLLLSEHLTKQQIASRLYLSPHTVDKYVRSIYAKLDVRTRLGAVMQAQALGYLRADA
jgi:DNA-binding CsgD family transcriptional regulator